MFSIRMFTLTIMKKKSVYRSDIAYCPISAKEPQHKKKKICENRRKKNVKIIFLYFRNVAIRFMLMLCGCFAVYLYNTHTVVSM